MQLQFKPEVVSQDCVFSPMFTSNLYKKHPKNQTTKPKVAQTSYLPIIMQSIQCAVLLLKKETTDLSSDRSNTKNMTLASLVFRSK